MDRDKIIIATQELQNALLAELEASHNEDIAKVEKKKAHYQTLKAKEAISWITNN